VGIITVDDIVDVIREEATEDIEKMAAMLPSQRPYLKTGVLEMAKNRIIWLLALMLSAMVTGYELTSFQEAFTVLPLLVTFIPMLMDTGGNAGSQSSTMIIRGMALSEIRLRDAGKVLWKEVRVSLLVGVILAAVNFARLVITYPGQSGVALVVAVSLLLTVVVAKSIGCLMPMLAQLLRFDPAIMASPLITTIVDAVSMILYFNIAQRVLGI
jgi:magnesium transporter